MKKLLLSLVPLLSLTAVSGREIPSLARPLDIPLVLSGNFGELRNNHFHSGLDFKTQGRTGFPVYAADDGYVSRIVVSPWGFGRAVYVTHPSIGLTTVYGHLDSFSPKIDKRVREIQYERESFRVDLSFPPGEIPVSRGEKIALSGNAGSSGGPHLHMDVRDSETEEALDPMTYYKPYIADNVAPEVRSLALYPVAGEGAVEHSGTAAVRQPAAFATPFTAWGKVIPAIKAYDRMSGTTNIYGVKHLTLSVDGKTVYSRTIDRFSFDDSRAVNTLVDYNGVVTQGSWMMWTRIPESEPLKGLVKADDRGILTIDEERDYKCEWTLTDEHGNTRVVPFTICGEMSEVPSRVSTGDRFDREGRNVYSTDGIKATFPAGTFYDDVDFSLTATPSATYLSPVYTIGDAATPITGEYTVEITLPDDPLADKEKYLLVRLNGKRASRVDSHYSNGVITGTPSSLGKFAVTSDVTSPVIKAELPATWGKKGRVSFIISDNLSGIKEWRGEIDGKFALFELDGKTGRLSFKMDPARFKPKTGHKITLKVTDNCGNTADFTGNVYW